MRPKRNLLLVADSLQAVLFRVHRPFRFEPSRFTPQHASYAFSFSHAVNSGDHNPAFTKSSIQRGQKAYFFTSASVQYIDARSG
jgi:hypothetical protein